MMTSDRDPVTPLLLVREAAVVGERDVVSRGARELGGGPRPGPADTRAQLTARLRTIIPRISRVADVIAPAGAHDRDRSPHRSAPEESR